MTQLAVAVDATDELWTLDNLPTPEAPYVEVEDELIEVRSRFPSQIYTLTGQELPPRIRVRRGIAGTTKASHIQGSTLTPNYGLGSGGGGGAIAVDNTVDAPVEVTTIIAPGAFFVGDVVTLGAWALIATGDDTATLNRDVEAPGDGDALAQTISDAGGAGTARATTEAINTGSGDAWATSSANVNTGIATNGVKAEATGVGGAADVTVSASTDDGDGGVLVSSSSTGNGAVATTVESAAASGSSQVTIQAANDADAISMVLAVTAPGVQSLVITGLPTADPSVAGALWSDAGALKVSAG